MKKEMTESAKCLLFEHYLLARSWKSAGRYLQVAQRFLGVNLRGGGALLGPTSEQVSRQPQQRRSTGEDSAVELRR